MTNINIIKFFNELFLINKDDQNIIIRYIISKSFQSTNSNWCLFKYFERIQEKKYYLLVLIFLRFISLF